MLQIKDVK